MALIEIDGLPISIAWWIFPVRELLVITCHNQMVNIPIFPKKTPQNHHISGGSTHPKRSASASGPVPMVGHQQPHDASNGQRIRTPTEGANPVGFNLQIGRFTKIKVFVWGFTRRIPDFLIFWLISFRFRGMFFGMSWGYFSWDLAS